MTKAVMEMMNSMTSLLREQQEYLKEALALLLDIYPTVQQLMDQTGSDEMKIRELQEQTGRWKTLCSALSEQNEVLTKQQQELLSFAGPLIQLPEVVEVFKEKVLGMKAPEHEHIRSRSR